MVDGRHTLPFCRSGAAPPRASLTRANWVPALQHTVAGCAFSRWVIYEPGDRTQRGAAWTLGAAYAHGTSTVLHTAHTYILLPYHCTRGAANLPLVGFCLPGWWLVISRRDIAPATGSSGAVTRTPPTPHTFLLLLLPSPLLSINVVGCRRGTWHFFTHTSQLVNTHSLVTCSFPHTVPSLLLMVLHGFLSTCRPPHYRPARAGHHPAPWVGRRKHAARTRARNLAPSRRRARSGALTGQPRGA